MKKNKMRISKQRFLLLFAGILLSCFANSQNVFTVDDSEDHPAQGGLPGQLRWAIEQANAASGESVINFNIPGSGPIIVNVYATLPVITKTVIIDGTTQPGYDPNNPGNPVIIINGYNHGMGLVTTGLSFSYTDRSKVYGVQLKQFVYGIILTSCTNCQIINNVMNEITYCCLSLSGSNFNTIKGNYINVNNTLASTGTNSEEGIFIDASNDNIIGGPNCGDANKIGYVYSEGIDNYPTKGQRNLYSGNLIFENDIGYSPRYEILLRTTGNGGKLPPVIATAGCDVSGTSQGNNTIELFGSSGPAASRLNAKVFLGSTKANAGGQWSMPVTNITYPFVVATATDSVNNTSELCTVQAIALDPLDLTIIQPPQVCNKEKVKFDIKGAKCLNGLSFTWDYGDGSAITSSFQHEYAVAGTYTITVTAYRGNYCQPLTQTAAVPVVSCSQFDCAPACNYTLTGTGLGTNPFVAGTANKVAASTLTATVTAIGGTGPFTFSWTVVNSVGTVPFGYVSSLPSNSSGVTFYNPGPATNYTATVKVTDATGCVTYKTFTQ
jgi:parallel beta-helix repeat protein